MTVEIIVTATNNVAQVDLHLFKAIHRCANLEVQITLFRNIKPATTLINVL